MCHSIRYLSHLLAVAALAACLVLGAAPASAEVEVVGTLEAVSVGTPHPYPGGGGADAWQHTFYYPGATYIRVHFRAFDLAEGDIVTITNPSTGESYTYDGRGPHGDGNFWAFSVGGDTAAVTLEALQGGAYGIEIDSLGVGRADLFAAASPSPETVCGASDMRDIKCYETSHPIEYARARGAVRLLIQGIYGCSGFKVSDSGQVMTNWHCIERLGAQPRDVEVFLEYQRPACGSGTGAYTSRVSGWQSLRFNPILDYSLFTTFGDTSSIPCLHLDPRLPVGYPLEGERIYIAGHPVGGYKQLTIASDFNAGGQCAIDVAPYDQPYSPADEFEVGYRCDTLEGSSGSPVLSGETHTVVALHHYGCGDACDLSCYNSGVRIDQICAQIGGVLGTCGGGCGPSADGDSTGDCCDNCPLVANPGQADADADRIGDSCDVCPLDFANDFDGDGVCGNVDNCQGTRNPDQADTDGDGIGDSCDPCPTGSCPPASEEPDPTPQPAPEYPRKKMMI